MSPYEHANFAVTPVLYPKNPHLSPLSSTSWRAPFLIEHQGVMLFITPTLCNLAAQDICPQPVGRATAASGPSHRGHACSSYSPHLLSYSNVWKCNPSCCHVDFYNESIESFKTPPRIYISLPKLSKRALCNVLLLKWDGNQRDFTSTRIGVLL